MKLSTGLMITVACLVLMAAPTAFAQHISVGIKAGVSLTDVVESESTYRLFLAKTKRFAIGPVVDIGLPLGFGIEVGALYKRIDQKSQSVTTTGYGIDGDGESYPIVVWNNLSAAGHSWEFPVAAQYHFFKSFIRPYVEGGVSFNHLSNIYNFQSLFPSFFPIRGPLPLPFTDGPTRSSFDRVGGLFGLGVDLKLHRVHVTPGFRYTHYNETRIWLPSANSVDFLMGFTF